MSLVMSRFTRGGIHGDNTDTIKKKKPRHSRLTAHLPTYRHNMLNRATTCPIVCDLGWIEQHERGEWGS
jgi:hypothetical protein